MSRAAANKKPTTNPVTVVPVTEFVSALKEAVIDRKITIPVLEFARLHGSTLSSTNLDMWAHAPIKSEGTVDVLIPVRKVLNVLNGERGFVMIEHIPAPTKGDGPAWVQLTVNGTTYKFQTSNLANFPASPKPGAHKFTVAADALHTLLERTMFAVSKEESRYTLNGLLMEATTERLRFVGTDGHRISVADHDGHFEGEAVKILLPLSAAQWIYKNFTEGDVQFGLSDNELTFINNGYVFTTRKMTGQFPNYHAVLPKTHSTEAVVPEGTDKIITRVAKCSDARSNDVKLTVGPNKSTLHASSASRGEATADLKLKVDGPVVTVGLNAAYMLEYLKLTEAEPTIRLKDAQSAVAFHLDNWTYIVMPMRI